MSANVASDDPPEIGIVDHTMNNGGPLYPIEVCEATIAVNETQNPESRHQRVKGSFLPLFSPFALCFPQETWTWIRLWFIFVVTFVVLWHFVVLVHCYGLLFVYWQWGWGCGGLKVTYGDSMMRFTRVTDHLWNTIYFNWMVSWLRPIAYVFRC